MLTEQTTAEALTEFVAHLRKIAELRAENRDQRPLHVWSSTEDLLLSMAGDPAGQPTVVSSLTLPEGVEAGPLRACYNNAFSTAARHPNLRYTEGYAFSGFFPTFHAWTTDVETGQIVDPTWVNLDYDGPFLYLGLVFSRTFVGRVVEETGSPSLFEDDWRRKGRTVKRGLVYDEHGHVADWGNPPPF